MDDGRGPGVQEVEALEDLPAPAPQHLGLHHLKPLQVAAGPHAHTAGQLRGQPPFIDRYIHDTFLCWGGINRVFKRGTSPSAKGTSPLAQFVFVV